MPAVARNARLAQHRFDHLRGQLSRGHAIRRQIARHVNKNLIHRIHADVLRRNIAQIDLVNLCAHLHIVRHLRRRDNIIQRQFRRNPERVRVAAFSVKSAVCAPIKRRALTCFTFSTTSKSLARPGMP